MASIPGDRVYAVYDRPWGRDGVLLQDDQQEGPRPHAWFRGGCDDRGQLLVSASALDRDVRGFGSHQVAAPARRLPSRRGFPFCRGPLAPSHAPAIGRTTDMGRPVHFSPGIDGATEQSAPGPCRARSSLPKLPIWLPKERYAANHRDRLSFCSEISVMSVEPR